MIENRIIYRIALIATLLALIVVLFGAYTRLKDAGLGCPDWPGCYGQVVAPHTPERVALAQSVFPGQVIDQAKAWTEMIHRYLAGTLAGFIMILCLLTLRYRNIPNRPVGAAIILIALVIFQALLGKWTVTLKLLPAVVLLHLLGGFSVLAMLWVICLRLGKLPMSPPAATQRFKPWAVLGIVVIAMQIFLGGWTSSNYAALICPDFPFCHGQLWPVSNLHMAFNFWMSIGTNYQGGVLDNAALISIQMMHRLGALITFVYIGGLALWILGVSKAPVLRKIAGTMLILLLIQVLLGVSNVLFLLPLPLAIAHNGVAALLLLALVTLNYALFTTPKLQAVRNPI